MRYKVLRCWYQGVHGEGVSVEGGMEEWDSLAEALNNLGPFQWEVVTPPFEMDVGENREVKVINLILGNRTTATEQERKQQANNLHRVLMKLEAKLASDRNPCDRVSQEKTISRIKEEIQSLLGSGSTSCGGAEPGAAPDRGGS
ncbi:MAG: hypothetical protein O3B01_08625 [Planctomycetota bacterium]|nr:hypothetical protein [Planctomycetota bacterium]